LNYH
jgi:hypothetical protein